MRALKNAVDFVYLRRFGKSYTIQFQTGLFILLPVKFSCQLCSLKPIIERLFDDPNGVPNADTLFLFTGIPIIFCWHFLLRRKYRLIDIDGVSTRVHLFSASANYSQHFSRRSNRRRNESGTLDLTDASRIGRSSQNSNCIQKAQDAVKEILR